MDNNNKKAYVIDPAYDKNEDEFIGIYYAEVTHEVIKPFLESKGYKLEFIPLSRPAQSTTNDVFCQTWSLLILLDLIKTKKYEDPHMEYKIPSTELKCYEIILDFYKDIFIDSMPELLENLQEEYNGSINDNDETEEQKEKLLKIDVAGLLYQMKKIDIKN